MNNYEIPSISTHLVGNSYVGRGIVLGATPSGKAVFAYFIMGRSTNSRNRIFVEKDGELITQPFDASKVEDPSLIIYTAVKKLENRLIVTNGDHTDTIYNALKSGGDFRSALLTRTFEPDAPIFTPRISGMITFSENDFQYDMSILKSVNAEGTGCVRCFYAYPSQRGLGHFIHTYACDGNPVPSFVGEPKRVAIYEDIDTFSQEIWDGLDLHNKISLYVRYTDPITGLHESRLINKNN